MIVIRTDLKIIRISVFVWIAVNEHISSSLLLSSKSSIFLSRSIHSLFPAVFCCLAVFSLTTVSFFWACSSLFTATLVPSCTASRLTRTLFCSCASQFLFPLRRLRENWGLCGCQTNDFTEVACYWCMLVPLSKLLSESSSFFESLLKDESRLGKLEADL